MRMLSVREVEFVSGGDDVQIPDVEITATRIKDNWDWLTLNYFLDSFSKSWDEIKNSWAEIADLFDRDNAEDKPKELSEMSDEERLKFWQDLVKELSPSQRAALHAALLAAGTNGGLSDQSIALAAMAGAIIAGDGAEAAAWHGHIITSGGGPSADAVLKSALDQVRFGS